MRRYVYFTAALLILTLPARAAAQTSLVFEISFAKELSGCWPWACWPSPEQ